MKKFLFILFGCCMALCGCDNDYLVGNEEPYKWKPVSYAYKVIDHNWYYIVPKEGGTFTFVCENYSPQPYRILSWYDDNRERVPCSYVKTEVKDQSVTFIIAPNDTVSRYCCADYQSACAMSGICFVQEGSK